MRANYEGSDCLANRGPLSPFESDRRECWNTLLCRVVFGRKATIETGGSLGRIGARHGGCYEGKDRFSAKAVIQRNVFLVIITSS